MGSRWRPSLALFTAALSAAVPVGAQEAPKANPVAFVGVTVVDVQAGKLVPNQTVVVAGNRIQTVGKANSARIPTDAVRIDGRGKYLMPGLWDVHVHVWGYPRTYYPLFIANGITGVRQMSEPGLGFDSLLQWRREINAGTRVGPRIIGTGGTIYSRPVPSEVMVKTAEDGRRVVDSLKAAGVDFIKFHEDRMEPEVYYAIAARAREVGIPLDGHLPNTITELEASDSGQRTVEHFNEIHCWWPENAWPPSIFPSPDSAGVQRCIDVAKRFAKNGTWFVPTLTITHLKNATLPERLQFWPEPIRRQAQALKQNGWGQYDPTLERAREIIRLLHQSGMPMLAGTDVVPAAPQITPGFSLHDELGFLVDAGLSPLEALRAATLNPAKAFKLTDSLGTVAPGKLADLVLLNADPLTDIRNTTKIHAVVANGRYLDRVKLDALLQEVEAAARE